ncbi:MAG: hypothetical protein WB697_18290 [Stellaceae bacterium]
MLASASSPAGAQSTHYDGVYVGTQRLIEGGPVANYSQCLKGPFKRRMTVKGSVATYTFNPTYQGQVSGSVTADGDVSGSSPEPAGGVALSGRMVGGGFSGQVWSLYCTYDVELKRSPQ